MKSGSTYSRKGIALLLLGEPKTGKTNVALAFPRPWVLDCGRNVTRVANVLAKGNKAWFFDDPYTTEAGTELAEDRRWDRAIELIKAAAKSPEVETLVIDDLTLLAEMLVAHLIRKAKEDDGKVIDRLRIQDYQPLQSLMTKLIILLRTTGKTIIVTAHQKADKDEATGRLRFVTNMPGDKLANAFPGLFSDVWATTSTNVGGVTKYELHVAPTGFHVNLGTSLEFPSTKPIDVTNKTHDQIQALLPLIPSSIANK